MYLSELIGGLRRRWWAAAAGLLATIALTLVAFSIVPPQQEAGASVIILPPAGVAAESGNPYLALGGLQPAADMLAAAMNSGSVHEGLAPSTGVAELEVARDTSSSGPMILVSVTEDDPVKALALLNSAIETMPRVLADLQKRVGVRNSNLLTVTEVTRDTQAEPSIKRQLRATLVAVVGGLAITIFGTSLLDGILLRRSSKRSQAVDANEEDEADAPTWDLPTDEPSTPGAGTREEHRAEEPVPDEVSSASDDLRDDQHYSSIPS